MSVLADRLEPYGRLFDKMSYVRLGPAATDADVAGLARLEGLTALPWLDLGNTQVTDAGLVHLAGLTMLTELSLRDTHITGAGLVHLAGLTKLKVLVLDNMQVTDAGLVHLAGLAKLQNLNLENTQITDAGLAHLAGLTHLLHHVLAVPCAARTYGLARGPWHYIPSKYSANPPFAGYGTAAHSSRRKCLWSG
jgi:hypothetical protein